MSRNIVMLCWADDSKPYEAFSTVKREFSERVYQSGVVSRHPNGSIELKDADEGMSNLGALGGGALGALLGIIGGPLGILLGFSTGALFGSIADSEDYLSDSTVISSVSSSLRPGSTALVLDVDEDNTGILDGIANSTGAKLTRFSYYEVLDEITAAEAAIEAAASEAEKTIKKEKRKEKKQEIEQRWENTKTKFKEFFSSHK